MIGQAKNNYNELRKQLFFFPLIRIGMKEDESIFTLKKVSVMVLPAEILGFLENQISSCFLDYFKQSKF